MRIPSFCKTKQWVILLTSLLLASQLTACGKDSSSIVTTHASRASTVQVAQAAAVTITEFSIPTTDSGPSGITRGPDGNFWFTESNTDKIGRITPKGTITEFSVPTTNSGAFDIVPGPDGNFWFTEYNSNKIGRITPKGTITEFPTLSTIPHGGPYGITRGPDGNL